MPRRSGGGGALTARSSSCSEFILTEREGWTTRVPLLWWGEVAPYKGVLGVLCVVPRALR
jgi:hypothetical protein